MTTMPRPPSQGAPDLVVKSPSVSGNNPPTGGLFTLSATVQNSGDGEAEATTLRYYRSTDATVTTSDTSVGTDSVEARRLLLLASYADARKPRGGSGHVPASARRALPLKRRSG